MMFREYNCPLILDGKLWILTTRNLRFARLDLAGSHPWNKTGHLIRSAFCLWCLGFNRIPFVEPSLPGTQLTLF